MYILTVQRGIAWAYWIIYPDGDVLLLLLLLFDVAKYKRAIGNKSMEMRARRSPRDRGGCSSFIFVKRDVGCCSYLQVDCFYVLLLCWFFFLVGTLRRAYEANIIVYFVILYR